MNLRTTLERLVNLLLKNPSAEQQSKLKTSAIKLLKAATDFEDLLTNSTVENSLEYATLAGLLNDPSKKKIASLVWANDHLKRLDLELLGGKSMSGPNKAKFLARIVKSNAATSIISELSRTPEQEFQDQFAQMATLSSEGVREALDNLKGKKLEQFADANAVMVVRKRSKSAPVDRIKTYDSILAALHQFKERQKL